MTKLTNCENNNITEINGVPVRGETDKRESELTVSRRLFMKENRNNRWSWDKSKL